MQITVVIPNFNGARWLRGCLAALERSTFDAFRVLIVDNGSSDESREVCAGASLCLEWLPLGRNYGFARAANEGIARADTPFLLLLNNDTLVREDFLEKLAERFHAQPAQVAAIQPLMLQMDAPALMDDAGDSLSWYGLATKNGHGQSLELYQQEGTVFSPSGGATLYRTDFLRNMGGFDEGFGSYLEDVDLGLRGRLQGFRYLYLPAAIVLHEGHGSAMPAARYVRLMTRNRLLLFVKNFPAHLLLAQLPRIAYGQLYFLLAYGRLLPILLGYVDFLRALKGALRQRKGILQETKLPPEAIEGLLTKDFPKPSIRQLVLDLAYNTLLLPLKKLTK